MPQEKPKEKIRDWYPVITNKFHRFKAAVKENVCYVRLVDDQSYNLEVVVNSSL